MSRVGIAQGVIILLLLVGGYFTFQDSIVGLFPIQGSSSQSSSKSSSTEEVTKPEVLASNYFKYRKGVLGQGTEVVLFFHAPWCPFCRQTDKRILALAATGAVLIPVYQVDYDTSEELKVDYLVLTQDTLVRIGAKGERLESIVHPTEEELAAFLRPFVSSSSSSS